MRVAKLGIAFIASMPAFAALLACSCSKPPEPTKDSITEEATGPAPGKSSIGAVNKARSTADQASSQVYKGDEGGK
jgi:hypothetical protein